MIRRPPWHSRSPSRKTQRGRDKALRDLGAYFIGSMKRRAVELTEKKMTPEEKDAFRGAKATEVRNFVASKAFEVLPEHLRPDKSQAIGMRWILTWKLKEGRLSQSEGESSAPRLPRRGLRTSCYNISCDDKADPSIGPSTISMEAMEGAEGRCGLELSSSPVSTLTNCIAFLVQRFVRP